MEEESGPSLLSGILFALEHLLLPGHYSTCLWISNMLVYHGSGRNALLLTVMDIYSRKVLIHLLRNSIKKGNVLVMLSLMLLEYKAEGMTLRNDNGSQFIANAVRQYLKEKGIYQVFSCCYS